MYKNLVVARWYVAIMMVVCGVKSLLSLFPYAYTIATVTYFRLELQTQPECPFVERPQSPDWIHLSSSSCSFMLYFIWSLYTYVYQNSYHINGFPLSVTTNTASNWIFFSAYKYLICMYINKMSPAWIYLIAFYRSGANECFLSPYCHFYSYAMLIWKKAGK